MSWPGAWSDTLPAGYRKINCVLFAASKFPRSNFTFSRSNARAGALLLPPALAPTPLMDRGVASFSNIRGAGIFFLNFAGRYHSIYWIMDIGRRVFIGWLRVFFAHKNPVIPLFVHYVICADHYFDLRVLFLAH